MSFHVELAKVRKGIRAAQGHRWARLRPASPFRLFGAAFSLAAAGPARPAPLPVHPAAGVSGWVWAWLGLLAVALVSCLGWIYTARLRKAMRRLEETVAARTDELAAMDQAVQAINRETDHEKLLDAMIRQAMNLIPQADLGVFLVHNESAGHFRMSTSVGVSPSSRWRTEPIPRSFFDQCIQHTRECRDGVYVLQTPPLPPGAEGGAAGKFPRSFIGIHIEVGGQLEGILALGNRSHADAFRCADAQKLSHLRTHATTAFLKSQAMEKLKHALAMADEARRFADSANQAKSDFLSCMSHELRTPLSVVIGFSEVMQEKYYGPLTEKQEEFVGEILGNSMHLLSLINDILDLAKIEAGKMDLRLSRFPLTATLSQSLSLIREKCYNRGVACSLVCDGELAGLEIEADQRKVKQVLYNLLSNAAKFTDKGAITLAARLLPDSGRLSDTRVEISVTDTGIGMGPTELERVFESFYQVKCSLIEKSARGTGLGLAIVKQLVELHGGIIWAESEGEGRGSRFVFRLPVRQAPSHAPETLFRSES